MHIYIIIPVHNRIAFTRQCLQCLAGQTWRDFSTIVVDDGSTDGTEQMIRTDFPKVILLRGDGELWWTKAANWGITHALELGAEWILTLNDDVLLEPGYLAHMAEAGVKYPGALIGSASTSVNEKDKISYCGERMNWPLAKMVHNTPNISSEAVESDFLPGRGLLIHKSVFSSIGLFDALNFPQSVADYDFVWKAKKAGSHVLCLLTAKIYSFENETGLAKFKSKKSFRNYWLYLFSKRSAANLVYRTKFYLKNCPWRFLPAAIVLDFIRVLGGYWKN